MEGKGPSGSAPEAEAGSGLEIVIVSNDANGGGSLERATGVKATVIRTPAKNIIGDKAADAGDPGGSKGSSSKKMVSFRRVVSSEAEDEDDDDSWDDFSVAEMKVLVREVEMRKEALFGDYKQGESPKYRWLIWQEVAEKVNEVNPCIHRNLEQVRVKWFDYKDPSNRWERRVKKKLYKHTTGMFFRRRTNSLATCPVDDSDGNQSSTEDKEKSKTDESKVSEADGSTGSESQSASQQSKSSKNGESLKTKVVLSSLNEDKTSKAIRYLSHLSQRQGMALVQTKPVPLQPSVETPNNGDTKEAEKDENSGKRKSEEASASGVNPPKRTYSRPKTDPVKGTMKSMMISGDFSNGGYAMKKVMPQGKLAGDPKATVTKPQTTPPKPAEQVQKPKEMLKVTPKTMAEMVHILTDYVVSSTTVIGPPNPSTETRSLVTNVTEEARVEPPESSGMTSGVKRSAKAVGRGGIQEPKRIKIGSSGSDVAALLKTFDPSKVRKIHIKHPKTGKDVLVTKIVAPEAMAALGDKLSPATLKVVSGNAKPSTSAESIGATASPPAAQTSAKTDTKLTVSPSKVVESGQPIATTSGQKSVGNTKVLASKDGQSSFPLLVPVEAIEKVTSSNNLLIKHPVTGKGIVISKFLKAPPTGVAPGISTVSAAAIPTGSNVVVKDSTGKILVPAGGKENTPGLPLTNVVVMTQPSTVTSNLVTVSKNQDASGSSKKLAGPQVAESTTEKRNVDPIEVEGGVEAEPELGETAMETGCETTIVIGRESSGAPAQGKQEAVSASSASPKIDATKADVIKSSETVIFGDRTADKTGPVREVRKDQPLEISGVVDNCAVTVPAVVSKSPPTVEKDAKESEVKVPSQTPALTPQALQSAELVQQILKGVGGTVVTNALGQISATKPAKWEGGEVRTLNIGGKTVKVMLVKDEDYSKILGKSPTSVLKNATLASTAAPPSPGGKSVGNAETVVTQGEAVSKVAGKLELEDVNKSPTKVTAVDGGSQGIAAVSGKGGEGSSLKAPTAVVKEHKGFLGFPPSPTKKPMGILGTPLGTLLTSVPTGSPNVTVVSMPQKVLSCTPTALRQPDIVESPKSVELSMPRKPNILSSAVKTAASSPGFVSLNPQPSQSTFGIKRVAPTSLQSTTSKLKVRVFKDEAECKELGKKQHPLVKAALSGKPIDFQEELRKLDPGEGTSKSELGADGTGVIKISTRSGPGSVKDTGCGDLGSKGAPSEPRHPTKAEMSPKVESESTNAGGSATAAPKDKPGLGVSGTSPSGAVLRVRSMESLRGIRISKKISLSPIAALNSGPLVETANASLAVRKEFKGSSGKRKPELVVNKITEAGKVARHFVSGLANELETIRETDDCVIIEEVDSRLLDPPEVFCVDSNDSYGVEVH